MNPNNNETQSNMDNPPAAPSAGQTTAGQSTTRPPEPTIIDAQQNVPRGTISAPNGLFTATCVIYLVILASFVLVRTAGGLGWFGILPDWAANVTFSFITQILLMTIIPIVGMIIYRRKFARPPDKNMSFSDFVKHNPDTISGGTHTRAILSDWWFKKPSAKIIGWSILLGVMCFFFNVFVSSAFNGILAAAGHRGAAGGGGLPAFFGVGGLFIVLFLTAVLPGICEEITHRGMLLRGFSDRIGIMRAVMLSSVLFGLMHLNIVQAFYAMVLGYLMALAMISTKNIWPAIIIHFINNALAVYISFASSYGWFGADLFNSIMGFVAGSMFIVYIGAFVGLYFGIIAIIHKLARDRFIRDNKSRPEPLPLHRLRGRIAIRYYVTADEPKTRAPLNPIEKTMIYGILFLGILVTVMTLIWGFL